MDAESRRTRREFLAVAGTVGAGMLLTGCRGIAATAGETDDRKDDEEGVTATEDLMREHGVLERVLGIYDEAIRRLDAHEALQAETLSDAAMVVRLFIEDYHEKQEESDVFPRIEKAGKLDGLTAVLRAQHKAGRAVTDEIVAHLERAPFNDADARRELAALLRNFGRMYRPHYAREDTVLFPMFRQVVPPKELDQLGDKFEERETKQLGPGGFEKYVAKVAQVEQALEIADLNKFTPKT